MPMNPLNWGFIETIFEIARGDFKIDSQSKQGLNEAQGIILKIDLSQI